MAIRIKLWADYGSYPPLSCFPNEKAELDFEREGINLWKQLRIEVILDYEVLYQNNDGQLFKHPYEIRETISIL